MKKVLDFCLIPFIFLNLCSWVDSLVQGRDVYILVSIFLICNLPMDALSIEESVVLTLTMQFLNCYGIGTFV